MRKFLPFVVIGILILSGFGAVALNLDVENLDSKTYNCEGIGEGERGFTHTILGEFGTATWCGYCKYAHAALKNIYAGCWYPFYYVSLVCDKNTKAYQRAINELGLTGYPTVYFDGGYKKNVGAGSTPGAQAAYNTSINSCSSRTINDVDIDLDVTWNGNAEMYIEVSIDNNEGSTYNGHLHVYVTEIVTSMGWIDSGGYPYTFPFLEYAWNEDISISSSSTWDDSITWDGHDYNDGYGNDFGGITYGNIMVIAAIFDSSTNYVDDTTGYRVGDNNPPNTPSNPDPEDGETNVDVYGELSWTCSDPDYDVLTFDVYLGKSSNPPLVASDNLGTTYDHPGLLDFDTKYYWKIVAKDSYGGTKTGPIWDFTTRGNEPPNTPSNPDPEDEETDVDIIADLSWTCSDPDGDPLTYDVYFGTDYPPQQVENNQTAKTYDPGILEFDTTYNWMIVAWDEYGYSTSGPIWSFTTEENLAPNTPSDPDPEHEETDVDINTDLSWTGGDPNNGDTVKYDIYFGTSSPPPLVLENHFTTTYGPGTLNYYTKYYWQIVAKDSQGLMSTGPIWEFTTEELNEPPTPPEINGPAGGAAGVEYCWTFQSDDPNNDIIYYIINWGDGSSTETECEEPNIPVETCHTYQAQGSYTITAKAKECPDGLESEESTLTVTMPKNKLLTNSLLLRFLERFPNAFQILRYILRL